MYRPDDFGMDWLATLAHVAPDDRDEMHGAFWQGWLRAASDHAAEFDPLRPEADPSDPTATHSLPGFGRAALGVRLEQPAHTRAGVVLLHGYAEVPTMAESIHRHRELLARGVAVLAMRVRGYSGSRHASGTAADDQHGWICQGLDAAAQSTERVHGWVLSETIADVLYAVAALRRALPPGVPIALMGESFGAGIATIAAAQAAAIESTHPEARVDRLVLGLPTLGDWGWRLRRTRLDAPGMGGEIARFIASRRGVEAGVRRVLSLFDAAVHARLVRCPTLCKVALRDETVPAPTQAAVCNALGAAPGEKARFVTPFGHYDGGLADSRRHALFERFAHEFLDPDHEPAKVIARWRPLMLQGSHPLSDVGDARESGR